MKKTALAGAMIVMAIAIIVVAGIVIANNKSTSSMSNSQANVSCKDTPAPPNMLTWKMDGSAETNPAYQEWQNKWGGCLNNEMERASESIHHKGG
jgi:ABC-type phosphate transport system substrate-binding protein